MATKQENLSRSVNTRTLLMIGWVCSVWTIKCAVGQTLAQLYNLTPPMPPCFACVAMQCGPAEMGFGSQQLVILIKR